MALSHRLTANAAWARVGLRERLGRGSSGSSSQREAVGEAVASRQSPVARHCVRWQCVRAEAVAEKQSVCDGGTTRHKSAAQLLVRHEMHVPRSRR